MRNESVIFQKRIDLGLTLRAAAKKLQISESLLDMIENGRVTHPNIAKRIQKLYKLTDEEYYQLIPENYRPGDKYEPTKYVHWNDLPENSKGEKIF